MSFISPSISDLASIVVFSGQNEASSPRGSEKSPQKRTMSRSTTSQVFGSSKVGTQVDEIHLFLGNNRISFLPHELFNIDALVVLSLRSYSYFRLVCSFQCSDVLFLSFRSQPIDGNPTAYFPIAKLAGIECFE